MCGLFGWQFVTANPVLYTKKLALASSLIRANDERGRHGWGFYLPRSAYLRKGLGYASGGIKVRKLANHDAVLGHTRYATQGDKDNPHNSHPFRLQQLVGAHNGIVQNHHELNAKYTRAFAVDSQHILAHLEEGRDLNEIEGYGTVTFVWLDRPDEIYLGLANGGSLAVLGLAGGGMLRSSTACDAWLAARTADLQGVFEYQLEDNTLYMVRDGALFKKGEFRFGAYCKSYWSSYSDYSRYTVDDYGREKQRVLHKGPLPAEEGDERVLRATKDFDDEDRELLVDWFGTTELSPAELQEFLAIRSELRQEYRQWQAGAYAKEARGQ
jgi:hypothetical protein